MNALNEYLESVRMAPFQWGVHDCFTFTNRAWRALYGRGWADEWAGEYMQDGRPLGRSELMRKFGFHTFAQAAQARLTAVRGVPPRGALVCSERAKKWVAGVALGICTGQSAAFVGQDGLIFHPIEEIDGAWIE